MSKPIISSFNTIAPQLIQKYERYLPTAFDESMTILEKLNKIIEHLNSIGELAENVVIQWNTVMEWVMNDGLNEGVNAKLDEMVADGTLESIINIGIIGLLSDLKTANKDNLVGAINDTQSNILESTGYGVIDGLEVKAQATTNMSVLITDGIIHLTDGKRYSLSGINSLPITTSDLESDRKDIVYVSNEGVISYLEGSLSGFAPTTPTGAYKLAEISVKANVNSITTSDIEDKRKMKQNNVQLGEKVENNILQLIDVNENLFGRGINIKNPPIPLIGAKGDGLTDDTTAINNILEYVRNNHIGMTVFAPNGTYIVGNVLLQTGVSFVGNGSRHTIFKKKEGTLGNVISFAQTLPVSYGFNNSFGGFQIEGTGIDYDLKTSVDSTNNGFVINPYWGEDGAQISDIRILNCGGTGLIVEPSPINTVNSEKMVLQQSIFNNISTEYCGNGAYIKGFVGNIQWNTCTFDWCNGNAFEIKIGDNGNGTQDNTFINCAFQHATKGFYIGGGMINANFYGCHFETNTLYGMHFNTFSVGHVVIDGAFFATSPTAIFIERLSDRISIDNCTWKALTPNSTTERFIKVASGISGMVYVGACHKMLNTIETPVEDPSYRIRGYKDLTMSKLEISGLKMYEGISTTNTLARNLVGYKNSNPGVSFVDVTFPRLEADENYYVTATPSWNSTVWVSDRTTTGFRINFGTPTPASVVSQTVWHLFR